MIFFILLSSLIPTLAGVSLLVSVRAAAMARAGLDPSLAPLNDVNLDLDDLFLYVHGFLSLHDADLLIVVGVCLINNVRVLFR